MIENLDGIGYGRTNSDGTPTTQAFEETRVWQKSHGRWRNVHFHRSKPGE